jgi:bacteriorhodopsin
VKRLRDTRAFHAARYRLIRTLAALVATAVAVHALVKVLVQSDRAASDWAYFGISCAVALAVWLVVARAPAPPEPRRANGRRRG